VQTTPKWAVMGSIAPSVDQLTCADLSPDCLIALRSFRLKDSGEVASSAMLIETFAGSLNTVSRNASYNHLVPRFHRRCNSARWAGMAKLWAKLDICRKTCGCVRLPTAC
jgi:hypothetical protein